MWLLLGDADVNNIVQCSLYYYFLRGPHENILDAPLLLPNKINFNEMGLSSPNSITNLVELGDPGPFDTLHFSASPEGNNNLIS